MACVALTSLIRSIEIEFLQPTSRVKLSLHRPLIKSFHANLSCLQAFLQNKSSGDGDGDGDGDLEIQIRDFALQAEDDIESQVSNFLLALLAKGPKHEEEASQELRQTLRKAAKIAAELLQIINKEKEHERKMACVALTSLIRSIEIEFLQPTSRVRMSLHRPLIKSFRANLCCLQAFLDNKSSGDGDALRDLEIQIRDFALKAEDDIKIQLSNTFLAEVDIEIQLSKREKAFHKLHQTLEEAAKNAAELLSESCVSEREKASVALTILITKFKHCINLPRFPEVYFGGAAAMESFLEMLFSLRACLLQEGNSNSNSNSGAAITKLETKIRVFALKAEDGLQIQLNNFLLAKHTSKEEAQKLSQTWQKAAGFATELLKSIKKEKASQEAAERAEVFLNCNKRSNEEVDEDEANQIQPLKHAAASNSPNVVESEGRMVGRHHDCTVIKDQLFSSHFQKLMIISIVGMVGIGKTTVARNVYEDPSVSSHFDVRGWVTIPQHYNKSRMLIDLLQSMTPVEPNVIKKGSTPNQLEMQVRECLRGRMYLIVLDNIMSNQALTDIKQCVPDDKFGSCILLTTRHFNLTDRYKYLSCYIHNMTLLDPKESWELFCNILSIDEEHLAPKYKKIRNHVVEKCDGLPQLIVEVAKRLSKCNNIQQGWKKIEKELESLGFLDHNELMVGYNMLPDSLKVCFLYFGVFPKRNKILVKMLIRLWIAEGFVKPLDHNELEDQVYEYLQELTNRSLLLLEDLSFDGKIKTCRMHSAMHSFCVVQAQREVIFCAVNTQQHLGLPLKAFANSCRWLSLYSHSFDYYVLFDMNIARSIFFFHENPEMFVPPKLLRVLAFDTSISLQRVPVQLGGLVFLRYLSITQWFEDLDDVVSDNPNLETLVVSGNGAPTVHLPSSIWKSPHLRHLELGSSYMVGPPSADKKNLQTLSWVVRPVHCRMKVYKKFPKIKNLKILLKDDLDPGHIGLYSRNPTILDHFNYLEGLEKLSISVSIGCNAALPKQCRYPLGLKKLKLSGTYISESDLNVIAKLPELKVLKLENAFHGTVWNVARGGFPKLISLLLEAKELKQWVLSNPGDLWELRHLVLRSCNCLEQIPKCQGYKLKSIELKGCHSSLVTSAKQFQQDFKYRNIEIKILDPKYDKSQNTDTEVSM
ncbi:PREDICTED: putative late blight resistance protein homolog R1A-10 [Ipomoea nil]|uniref:putative late blight resistance protein homolog R1A-10 n=1 Tax=Ipomoea nil TaxID=35883 RepID=UPI000901EEEA|nr:PREDICTED: putative late blight resistance protein homolog R1A-10 [Ipomoea nil]XP_019198230.1 PREDICTED: putative late blight resistance protein homolog R1A-10 [Ipomoea nil]